MNHVADQAFDTLFLRQNMMGPNCVRLAEELLERVDIASSRRILDLGCGMGLTSLLLAKKFSATIFAFDLWIEATDNHERFAAFGLDERILPVHGEARDLPFARGYFDAVVSIDSYQYYGDQEGFLDERIAPFVKSGGVIALVVPGVKEDFPPEVPEILLPYWHFGDMHFYPASWWAALFARSNAVRLEQCFSLASHGEAWRDWLQSDHEYAVRDRDMIRDENGQYFDTIGLIARVL